MNTNLQLVDLSHKMEYRLYFPILHRGSTQPDYEIIQVHYYSLILEFSNHNLDVLLPKLRQFDVYYHTIGCSSALFYLLKTDGLAIRPNGYDALIRLQQSYRNALLEWDLTPLSDDLFPKELYCNLEIETETGYLVPLYELKGITDFFAFELMHLMRQTEKIKTCHNCNRLFLPTKRSDEKYCEHVGSNGKTCKQIGYASTIRKDNPFQYEYRKAYKTQYARIRYFTHIENYKEFYFDQWNRAAKEAKVLFETAHDINGFRDWLADSQKRFKPEKLRKEYSA